MTAVFGDDGPDGRHVPDLMTQRSRIIAVKRLLTMAAGRQFAVVDGVSYCWTMAKIATCAAGGIWSQSSAGMGGRKLMQLTYNPS